MDRPPSLDLVVGWAETSLGESHGCLWLSAGLPPVDFGTLGSGASPAHSIQADKSWVMTA